MILIRLLTCIGLASCCLSAIGAVDENKAAELGTQLTPMGAERAASADGRIPEWRGGLAQQAVDREQGYVDPYADEQVLFTITRDNLEQHKQHLTPGQIRMFEYRPDYTMPVYPSHRTASFPDEVYQAVKRNATSAQLEGTDSLSGAVTGPAFPIPQNGAEVIWNHKTKYLSPGVKSYYNAAVVSESGNYFVSRVLRYVSLKYNQIGITPQDLDDNVFLYYLTYVLSPTRLAGNIVLVHQKIDQLKDPNVAWVYNPGQRRVRRAPELGYDNPTLATDSLGTHDQIDMFNGAMDRYQWTLAGKREIYIPYNAYKLEQRDLDTDEIIKAGHINQDLTRYELHRVWVVDATVRPGTNHVYKRRTFYVDEDSWHIVLVDMYDQRDQLWRMQAGHLINVYNIPAVTTALEVGYDFAIGRYVVAGLDNKEDMADFDWYEDASFFTPKAIRRHGIQ